MNNEMSSENAAAVVDPKLVGIGGWLIFLSIGLVLGGILSIVGIIMGVATFAKVAEAGYGGYFGLNIVIQIGMFIYLIVAASRFFGKKKSAPGTMIGLMVAGIATGILTTMVAFGANAEAFEVEEIKALVKQVIGAAIWIPYFRTSKRVAATFTN